MAAGDSEAEALGDPSHPDGFWGKWVDGPRPGDDDAVAERTPLLPAARAARKLHTPAGLAALHSNFYRYLCVFVCVCVCVCVCVPARRKRLSNPNRRILS
jgi:hypothetical protein